MGRHKVQYRKYLLTVAVSEQAAAYIKAYGGTLAREPFYRRLDRFIANCKEKDIVQLGDTVERQGKSIDYYIKRIKELEAVIDSKPYTLL